LDCWEHSLRTVSWLTFVGEYLMTEGRGSHGIASIADHEITVSSEGTAAAIQAGALPCRGDVNRLEIPARYVSVDKAMRLIRATEGPSLSHAWTREQSSRWLRRFECW
ncbi:MAG TPA: type VI immunity family protein, partial [Polyangiaceae bacterium]|nr:type VI immunity family protein [Polyangiaceae bacterium]